ncbi:MAG: tyrosine-type recombinase/integrase, partial [Selenomonadaceae bacterium]
NQASDDMSLKSKASNREIPVISSLKQILDVTPKRDLFIVTRSSGSKSHWTGIMTLHSFRRMWEDYVKKEVDFEIRPHMLRHTYATILYNAGIDLKAAQTLMGHSDIQMTANIYTHIESDQTKKSALKIETYLFPKEDEKKEDEKSEVVN